MFENLQTRTANIFENSLMIAATFLDPRYRNLKFIKNQYDRDIASFKAHKYIKNIYMSKFRYYLNNIYQNLLNFYIIFTFIEINLIKG